MIGRGILISIDIGSSECLTQPVTQPVTQLETQLVTH